MTTAAEVLAFWTSAGPSKWYASDEEFDQEIRNQFGAVWQDACDGDLPDWATDARGALALVILLDQFPRNMFRNDPRAFATDPQALVLADTCLANGWDHEIAEPERQFIYMPYMHSEELDIQDKGVTLMETRMEEGNNDLHARVHREIIKRFGRFPYRNEALGRETTVREQSFIDAGGYGGIFREMEREASA